MGSNKNTNAIANENRPKSSTPRYLPAKMKRTKRRKELKEEKEYCRTFLVNDGC
jgi:hypothetical protein